MFRRKIAYRRYTRYALGRKIKTCQKSSEASRIGHREALSCDAVSVVDLAVLTVSPEEGLALQRCPKMQLRGQGLSNPVLTSHWKCTLCWYMAYHEARWLPFQSNCQKGTLLWAISQQHSRQLGVRVTVLKGYWAEHLSIYQSFPFVPSFCIFLSVCWFMPLPYPTQLPFSPKPSHFFFFLTFGPDGLLTV